MEKNIDKKTQGKKNREAGQRFEVKVRKDLESKGWIVDRWSNNVEFGTYTKGSFNEFELRAWKDLTLQNGKHYPNPCARLISARSRFSLRTTGFPDFIAFRGVLDKFSKYKSEIPLVEIGRENLINDMENEVKEIYEVIGIECKSRGILTKEEKEKCRWLLQQQIFSKILIAKKGTKRGQIVYTKYNHGGEGNGNRN